MQDYDAGKERQVASRRAHQFTDSARSVWLSGARGPEYHTQTPNPVTVRDVAQFKARRPSPGVQDPEKLPPVKDAGPKASKEGRPTFDYGWFDRLRAQQLVPTTHNILTYSDPSSTRLQPRSLLNPSGYTTTTDKHTS